MISIVFWTLLGPGRFVLDRPTETELFNAWILSCCIEFLLVFILQMLICFYAKKKWAKRIFPVLAVGEIVIGVGFFILTFSQYDRLTLLEMMGRFVGLPSFYAMAFLVAVLLANAVYRLVNYVRQKNQNTVLQVE